MLSEGCKCDKNEGSLRTKSPMLQKLYSILHDTPDATLTYPQDHLCPPIVPAANAHGRYE